MLGSNPSADPRTRPKRGAKPMVPPFFCFTLPETSGWYKAINPLTKRFPFLIISVTEPGFPVGQSID